MAGAVKRNFKAIAADICEGFITMNPIYLKPFDGPSLKALLTALERKQVEIRSTPFPYHDLAEIRSRNLRLQRLYTALTVIKSYAREKRIPLL